jgi:hypothetical protein
MVVAGMADGSVRTFSGDLDVQVIRKLSDPNDGEVIENID